MHPIPIKLREKMTNDNSMKVCIYNNSDCSGRVEWDHVWNYANRQIQEEWAILPTCYKHHRGGLLNREFSQYKSLEKAFYILKIGLDKIIIKYPKKDWNQIWVYLKNKYENK